MKIRPIPRELLTHTVTLKHRVPGGVWGGINEVPQVLERVRIEPKQALTYTKSNQALTLTTVLFIDAVHSTPPAGIDLDDTVEFGGDVYTVKSIARQHALDSFHHYEIGLV